jgi:peptidoglycan-N-acetylglucosamine deacetylase
MKKTISCFILLIFLITEPCFAQEREIAITIDDLPFVGTNSNDAGNLRRTHKRFMSILNALIENQVPATGFIIANSIGKGQWELLEEFRKEGFELGNHTYSHENLNRISAGKYIDNISKADRILQPVMTNPKYFRYPYLAEGKGAKKQEVQDYLTANQYIIAPVTIDSKDYKFNARFLNISWRVRGQYLNRIKQQYLNYIWRQTLRAERNSNGRTKQILLIHANLLNSHCLGDIIKMYKKHGYKFITLKEALEDTSPATTDDDDSEELADNDDDTKNSPVAMD